MSDKMLIMLENTALKHELGNVKQEREVYKKALELACEEIYSKLGCFDKARSSVDDVRNYFLQKAREK